MLLNGLVLALFVSWCLGFCLCCLNENMFWGLIWCSVLLRGFGGGRTTKHILEKVRFQTTSVGLACLGVPRAKQQRAVSIAPAAMQ